MRRRAARPGASGYRAVRLIGVLLLLTCLSVTAQAGWEETELAEQLGAEELNELAEEHELDRYGNVVSFDFAGALREICRKAVRAAISERALRRTGAAMLTVLLCSLLRSAFGAVGGKVDVLSFAGAAAIAALTLDGSDALISLSVETLENAQDTANVLLPVLSGAALLSGSVTAAAAKYASAAFFLNILVNLCMNGVIPVVRLYALGAAAEAAMDSEQLSGVLGLLKWCVTTALTVLLLSFMVYISLSGLLNGSADAALLRGTKTAISTMLPLVGGIASDAASAILAAAGTVRQSVGVVGVVLLAAVLLLPFLRVGVQYLLFKGAAAASAGLADGRLRKLLTRLSETMAMLLACIGSCGILLYFSIFSLMEVTLR